jgi:hypothetical protein
MGKMVELFDLLTKREPEILRVLLEHVRKLGLVPTLLIFLVVRIPKLVIIYLVFRELFLTVWS